MALYTNATLHLVSSVFALPFQILNLHIFISFYTQFHHLYLAVLLVDFPGDCYWSLYLNFLVLSILVTWPIQFNRLILTNEIISKSPNSCGNSLLFCVLQFLFICITPEPRPQNSSQNIPFKSSQPFSDICIRYSTFCSASCHLLLFQLIFWGHKCLIYLIFIYKFSCLTLLSTNLEDNLEDNNLVENISDVSLDIQSMDQNVIRFHTLTPRNMAFTILGFQAILSARYLSKCRESILPQVQGYSKWFSGF